MRTSCIHCSDLSLGHSPGKQPPCQEYDDFDDYDEDNGKKKVGTSGLKTSSRISGGSPPKASMESTKEAIASSASSTFFFRFFIKNFRKILIHFSLDLRIQSTECREITHLDSCLSAQLLSKAILLVLLSQQYILHLSINGS